MTSVYLRGGWLGPSFDLLTYRSHVALASARAKRLPRQFTNSCCSSCVTHAGEARTQALGNSCSQHS